MGKCCFGVDVGGTTVKMGLFTPDGDLLEKWEIPTRTEDQGSHIISDIAEAIERKITEAGLVRDDIIGIGVGALEMPAVGIDIKVQFVSFENEA